MKQLQMMFKIVSLIILGTTMSWAQNVDYNSIILPDGIEDIGMEEKLVRLAWKNYPANEAAKREVLKAKHNIGVAGSNWLSSITISGNLNEFNIDPAAAPNNNNFFPRYNVGIRMPLGIFMETPRKIKIAKEDYKISELNLNQLKLTLRAEVLKRYQNYLSAKELLKIDSEAENDAYNSYLLIEKQFQSGEVNVSQFMQTSKIYNDQRAKRIVSEANYAISIIEIEELVGVRLQDVR